MTALKWINDHLEKWFLILSLIVMVLVTTMQVVLREFGNATVWAEELCRYIMLYQVWVGASYAIHEDAHIRITALTNILKEKNKLKLELVVLTVWLIFALWLMIEGCVLVNKVAIMGQLSPAMQIPMEVPYASVPLGGLLMAIRLVQKIVETLKKLSAEEEAA